MMLAQHVLPLGNMGHVIAVPRLICPPCGDFVGIQELWNFLMKKMTL
jgi:hypothetical protein